MKLQVPIDRVETGSVLARSVRKDGRTLLAEGDTLTIRRIVLLKKWDVETVLIHTDDQKVA